MATERQIEANRRNALLSSGPKTEAGKARSRANATTHGLAGESAEVHRSEEFENRRTLWAAERKPVGESAGWALDRAVAASLRIERCERAMDDLTEATRQQAALGWDEAREVEAAETFARLGRDPVRASRKLRSTLAGALLLIDAWVGLDRALIADGDWSEAEAARALDLLGVAPDLRKGRTAIEPLDGLDRPSFRRALVAETIEGLERLIDESLIPLDEGDRRREATGDLALLSRPGRLLARYERDAWRRYRESIAELEAPEAPPVAPIPTPIRRAAPTPKPVEPPSRTFEQERREIMAEVAAFRQAAEAHGFTGFDIEDDGEDVPSWMVELERSLDDRAPAPRDGTNPIPALQPARG